MIRINNLLKILVRVYNYSIFELSNINFTLKVENLMQSLYHYIHEHQFVNGCCVSITVEICLVIII